MNNEMDRNAVALPLPQTNLTTLRVNLSAMAANVSAIKKAIGSNAGGTGRTKILALVKANAYGVGLCKIGRFLEEQQVDYLGAALADEGTALRQAGITLPIVCLNPEEGVFHQMIKYSLEPEIYSMASLQRFADVVRSSGMCGYPIHIKLDTGMHRLGFMPQESDALVDALRAAQPILRVASIFSHLAAADEVPQDAFTLKQMSLFSEWSSSIRTKLGGEHDIMLHLANSWGTLRFAAAHCDMVRVGAALYGISAVADSRISSVCSLHSAIVQIKQIPAGDSVGYGCRFRATTDTTIGIVPAGYTDGIDRRLGNGRWSVSVNGRMAPIIGSICMDLCMIDLTGITAHVGDEVVIFGSSPTIENMAEQLDTISYEILTRTAPRVRRIYYHE